MSPVGEREDRVSEERASEAGSETASAAASAPVAAAKIRLWPAFVILAMEACAIFVPQTVAPNTLVHIVGIVGGPILGTLAIFVWWLRSTRESWKRRGAVVLALLVVFVAVALVMDRSMGLVLVIYALPLATVASVIAVGVTRNLAWPARFCSVLAAFLLALGPVAFLRMEGTSGSLQAALAWRWQPKPEQRALAALEAYERAAGKLPLPAPEKAGLEIASGDWPEFRGPNRDGKVAGVRIGADWFAAPVELWRRPVGPGWSSFAIVGQLAFTQEQRGGEEAVVCYHTATGRQVWVHADAAKFDETMGGVGPRATPTAGQGRLYTLGASGAVHCLDPAGGEPVWSRDLLKDTGAPIPKWGFSSSPLLCGDAVIVYAGGEAGIVAYDRRSGEKLWTSAAGTHSYSSPQLATVAGVGMILMMSNAGLTAVEPETGARLWQYDWWIDEGARIVQPAVIEGSAILVGTGYGHGTQRIRVAQGADGWHISKVWETRRLKPYFNDFVCHRGCVYGFDEEILACLDLASGERLWKGGRYGHGQLLLLEDQNALLVLSERGDVALVAADPGRFTELASFHALEGKTWNHPVIAQGKLFVRNATEAACYELPTVHAP